MRIELALPCDQDAPARARSALSEVQDRVPAAVLGDARLLLSEVVTNAVRHAGLSAEDRIVLGIRAEEERLLVEVRDAGPGFNSRTRPEAPEAGASSGYGLYLVETLADDWGVSEDGGTRVWFAFRTGT